MTYTIRSTSTTSSTSSASSAHAVGTLTAVSTPAMRLGSASASGPPVSNLLLTTLLSAAVIGAAITSLVNLILTRRKGLEDEGARIRSTCAEAFEVVAQYEEFPYAIRRRRKDMPAEERVRLSEELRTVQARLSYFSAWMHGEDATLSATFDQLVAQLRKVAGRACHDAWLSPPADSDADMNFTPGVVDLSPVTVYEDAFIAAVSSHLDGLLKTRRIFQISWHR